MGLVQVRTLVLMLCFKRRLSDMNVCFSPLSAPASMTPEDSLGECGHGLSCLNLLLQLWGVVYVTFLVFLRICHHLGANTDRPE